MGVRQQYISALIAAVIALSNVSVVQAASVTASASQVESTRADAKILPSQGASESDDAADEGLATAARSAVVMDYATGKILYEKDANEKLPMASITKIMTMLLIMEALDKGKIHLNDKVTVSENASSMGGSQVFLQPGETMTVDDMLKAIAMASANDACVAMAEHLYGSQEAFVRQMNRRAKQLDMKNTHFMNCNGLPAPNHYSSAHDIAVMSRALLKHERITKYTSVYSDYLRKDSEHPFWLVNTNKLVRFYEGVDGLKTGYTQEAKFCLAATAKKNGFRVIAVVMGEPKPAVRNMEVSELLNWSFSQFTSNILYKEGQVVAEPKVSHGIPETLKVVTADTVGIVQKSGEEVKYDTQLKLKKLSPPIREGQKVGSLKVLENGEVVAKVPLVAAHSVKRAGLFQTIGRTLRDLVTFGR